MVSGVPHWSQNARPTPGEDGELLAGAGDDDGDAAWPLRTPETGDGVRCRGEFGGDAIEQRASVRSAQIDEVSRAAVGEVHGARRQCGRNTWHCAGCRGGQRGAIYLS